MNDPNGPIYYHGVYHLFYQLHPFSDGDGPKYWGHVRSRDLAEMGTVSPSRLWPSDRTGRSRSLVRLLHHQWPGRTDDFLHQRRRRTIAPDSRRTMGRHRRPRLGHLAQIPGQSACFPKPCMAAGRSMTGATLYFPRPAQNLPRHRRQPEPSQGRPGRCEYLRSAKPGVDAMEISRRDVYHSRPGRAHGRMPQLFQARRTLGPFRLALRQGAIFRRRFRRRDLPLPRPHPRPGRTRAWILRAEHDATGRRPPPRLGLGQRLPRRPRLERLPLPPAPAQRLQRRTTAPDPGSATPPPAGPASVWGPATLTKVNTTFPLTDTNVLEINARLRLPQAGELVVALQDATAHEPAAVMTVDKSKFKMDDFAAPLAGGGRGGKLPCTSSSTGPCSKSTSMTPFA